ncbi:ABC-2 type transport system permease protein [Micromonospora eburnea]|uniref:ABC-2 type transport system permease protein n=1 Tax=Micromonospora eburnea TaxID=227316 RepID=A0A1C6V178_9ACTN|nr:ABC-2 type transport system permease protein [Micromonospora eburnea]
MSDTAWRLGLTARLGVVEFREANPDWVIWSALVPRAILQALFFTVLGGVIGGDDAKAYTFVGALAGSVTLSGAVAVIDVPLVDKWFGTFFRLRTGQLKPILVFLMRTLPYPVLGLVFILSAMVVVGPLTGQTALVLDLVPWLPLFFLMSVTTTAAGLACAALAVGKRANVLVGNLLAYLILLASGVFLPSGQVTWVDWIGSVLPIRHGLQAVRDGLEGRPWLGGVVAEIVVGVAWGLLAWAVVAIQVRRAHRHGFDSFS